MYRAIACARSDASFASPAYRKPFVPPSDSEPLVIRSTTYGGEEHPATERRIIVVPVAKLPLKNEKAIHKFKVLAGVRWTPDAPTDSGIAPNENGDEHGYFKISAEHFDVGAMNLKWASDTLDRLIAEANVRCSSMCMFVCLPIFLLFRT